MTIDQPIVTSEPDAELMRLIGEFEKTRAAQHQAREAYSREMRRIEALPDCPPDVRYCDDLEAFKRREAFIDSHGPLTISNERNKLGRFAGALAYQIFATPAKTLRGAVDKLKLIRLAYGDAPGEGDVDLACYVCDSVEMRDESWFASVMEDLERLSDTPA